MQVTITLSQEAAQGFTDAGIDPAPVIEQRANEIGKAHAHSAKIRSRKELVQEIESSGDIDEAYAVARLMQSATYRNLLISGLRENAIPFEAGLSVLKDQSVLYEDQVYLVIQDHTTQSDWLPPNVPALFRLVVESVIDDETGQETYPAWVQPAGGHDAYNTGDRVSFEGRNYESSIDANVWSPTGYPAGWTDLGPV